MKPLIVGFDGLNKSGKSTLINSVRQKLSDHKVKVLHGLKDGLSNKESFKATFNDLKFGKYENWIEYHIKEALEAHKLTLLEALNTLNLYDDYDIVLMDRTFLSWVEYSRRVDDLYIKSHSYKNLAKQYNKFINDHKIELLCHELIKYHDLLFRVRSDKQIYIHPYRKELKRVACVENKLTFTTTQVYLEHTDEDLAIKTDFVINKILKLLGEKNANNN